MAWGKTKAQEALEKAEYEKLLARMSRKSYDPTEDLARNCRRYLELTTKLEQLNAEKEALNAYIKSQVTARDEGLMVNDTKKDGVCYLLIIKCSQQTRMSTDAAKKYLTPEQIAACSKTVPIEALSITEVARA